MYMGGCSSVRRSAAHQGRSRRGGGCGGRTRRGGGAGGIRRPAAPLAAARTLGGRAAGARSASEHGSRRSNARALPFFLSLETVAPPPRLTPLSLSQDRRDAACDATILSLPLCLYLSTAQWRRRSLVKKHEHAGLSRPWPRRPARRHYSFFLSPALSLSRSVATLLSLETVAPPRATQHEHTVASPPRATPLFPLSPAPSLPLSRDAAFSLSLVMKHEHAPRISATKARPRRRWRWRRLHSRRRAVDVLRCPTRWFYRAVQALDRWLKGWIHFLGEIGEGGFLRSLSAAL